MKFKRRRVVAGSCSAVCRGQGLITARDADDLAAGEKAGEGVESDAIVGVIERRNDHELVGDIKIGVAGGQALIIEINWRGHGKRFNSERAAVEVFHGLQQSEIFLKGNVVGVVGVLLDHGDDGRWAYEASEVVDMAMGIVAGDSIF